MTSAIETDVSAFPIVVVRLPDRPVTDDDLRAFVADQRAMLGRRQRHAVIADASHARAISPVQRKILADWLEEAEPLNKKYTVCIAVVLDNALIRGAMTAVLWLKQPASPTKSFATLDEAAAWALEALRRANVEDLGAAEAFVARPRARRAAR